MGGRQANRERKEVMTYRGQVKNGQIVLEDNVILPEGTAVTVQPEASTSPAAEPQGRTFFERFENVIGMAKDLPADFAEQHDHYIHGTPRK
jgi:hypothetical protein